MSYCSDHNHNPDPASPAALWENARGCWQAFALLFGTPLQLLGEVFIRRSERNHANAFLRSLEALVRRLLLTEAIQILPRTGDVAEGRRGTAPGTSLNPTIRPPPVLPRSGEEPKMLGSAELDTEDATTWPAHFALRLNILLGANLAERRTSNSLRNRPHPPPHPHDLEDSLPKFDFAAPIALRIEALRRVIRQPDTYIRRTAHALAAFRRRNRPPILLPAPAIAGDSQRFFHTPLARITATAASAVDRLWADTS